MDGAHVSSLADGGFLATLARDEHVAVGGALVKGVGEGADRFGVVDNLLDLRFDGFDTRVKLFGDGSILGSHLVLDGLERRLQLGVEGFPGGGQLGGQRCLPSGELVDERAVHSVDVFNESEGIVDERRNTSHRLFGSPETVGDNADSPLDGSETDAEVGDGLGGTRDFYFNAESIVVLRKGNGGDGSEAKKLGQHSSD